MSSKRSTQTLLRTLVRFTGAVALIYALTLMVSPLETTYQLFTTWLFCAAGLIYYLTEEEENQKNIWWRTVSWLLWLGYLLAFFRIVYLFTVSAMHG